MRYSLNNKDLEIFNYPKILDVIESFEKDIERLQEFLLKKEFTETSDIFLNDYFLGKTKITKIAYFIKSEVANQLSSIFSSTNHENLILKISDHKIRYGRIRMEVVGSKIFKNITNILNSIFFPNFEEINKNRLTYDEYDLLLLDLRKLIQYITILKTEIFDFYINNTDQILSSSNNIDFEAEKYILNGLDFVKKILEQKNISEKYSKFLNQKLLEIEQELSIPKQQRSTSKIRNYIVEIMLVIASLTSFVADAKPAFENLKEALSIINQETVKNIQNDVKNEEKEKKENTNIEIQNFPII
ncbi:hypothetical protein [Leptospira paudalimensis]|uniref:Uncharacterized protein n=1 Tax=Leptospira paudalimensis TaxID=2950024 RepID=A0ABT3M589_9LEPT|nr:hypothetical protein [Leptospira paudalimensis]MCW7503557.1 hypothetical protein [Leptospira paudalimensis]